ncbi:MAG: hypothetical protein ACKPKO_43700, partial [Candidatus Fonsibacter sp.]
LADFFAVQATIKFTKMQKTKFNYRLQKYDAPEEIIQSISKTIPIRRQQFTPSTYRQLAQSPAKAKVAWLPLPFHSVWRQSGIAGAVRSSCERRRNRELATLAGIIPDVRVTWKLISKPFNVLIARD